MRIFFSYASEDRQAVAGVYQALSDAGLLPWMDIKNILPGETWELRIEQAIREADFILIFLSRRSVQKRGVLRKEWKIALDIAQGMLENDIFVIPVRFEECEMPPSLQHLQRVDLFQPDGLAHLLKAIQEGAGRRKKGEIATSQGSKKHQEDAQPDVTAEQLGLSDSHLRGGMSKTKDLSSMSQLNNIAALTELMDQHSTSIDIMRLIGELYSQHNIPEFRSYDSVKGATKWDKIYNVLQIMQGYGRERMCDVLQILAKYRPSDVELTNEVERLCSRRTYSSTGGDPDKPINGPQQNASADQIEIRMRLRDELANLYSDQASAAIIAEVAGLDVKRIQTDPKISNYWYAILKEAELQGAMDNILRLANREYPNYTPLQEVTQQYNVGHL